MVTHPDIGARLSPGPCHLMAVQSNFNFHPCSYEGWRTIDKCISSYINIGEIQLSILTRKFFYYCLRCVGKMWNVQRDPVGLKINFQWPIVFPKGLRVRSIALLVGLTVEIVSFDTWSWAIVSIYGGAFVGQISQIHFYFISCDSWLFGIWRGKQCS